jgi:Chaperone of endosialidase
VPEWSNGAVSKTVVRATGPWVRIPPSPPDLERIFGQRPGGAALSRVSFPTAIGDAALYSNASGSRNTALGTYALVGSTGSRSLGVGHAAGGSNTTGTDNIWIGHSGFTESNTLRIGNGTGDGYFEINRAFIAGIHAATGTFDEAVCVNSSNQLGVCSGSSARFKEDVRDMGSESPSVLELRPATFRYTKEFAGEGERPVQTGLIAEEVAASFRSS